MNTVYFENQTLELQRPPAGDGPAFEDMCLTVYREHYGSKEAMFYNRGHMQHGIDLLVPETRANGTRQNVVIQCKNTKALDDKIIKDDIQAAVRRWIPSATRDADLLFILATTVDHPKSSTYEDIFKEACKAFTLPPGRTARIAVHGWPTINSIVQEPGPLRTYFLEPRDPPGTIHDIRDEQCVHRIREHLGAYNLGKANSLLGEIKTPYVKLPMKARSTLVDLFVAAGDFDALDKLLPTMLGVRRFDAGYWIAYLRAERFCGAVHEPKHFLELMGQRKRFPLADTISDHEASLLSAIGSLDQKLTLALWAVVYGEEPVASRGLVRALSLIRQYWKEVTSVQMPRPGESWTIRNDRLIPGCNPLPGDPTEAVATDDQRAAVALVHAYEYVRLVFQTRFGYSALCLLEADADGWTYFTENRHSLVDNYFSVKFPEFGNGNPELKRVGLVLFSEEAQRMEFDWVEARRMVDVISMPRLLPYSVICTSDVFLSDCETGQHLQRKAQAHLRTSTFAIERVLAVRRMQEMQAEEDIMRRQQRERSIFAPRLERFEQVIGSCSLKKARLDNDVIVLPAYIDWEPGPAQEPRSRTELRLSLAWANASQQILVLNDDHADRDLHALAERPVQFTWHCGRPRYY